MSKFNPKVDAYIMDAADFAKPILEHLRQIIHENCPEVEEKIKWSFPHFDYLGQMMCSFAAFKHHCAFNLWKASLMSDPRLMENAKTENSMGHMKKIFSIEDLPKPSILAGYITESMELTSKGIKIKKPKIVVTKPFDIPSDFEDKLIENSLAYGNFEKSSYSFKKEYLNWINEAKTESTRQKRINQAIEWISENKGRNWKYES
jgi:uncharacterized protein YdeI (YjbR/CyaY-like superfamily)